MALKHYFYFSYARVNRKNASRERNDGSTYNLVDQFFQRLCQCVSDNVKGNPETVGYRDLTDLHVSAQWPQELVNALQVSPVQIALISPHYFGSLNCGREFEFFTRRFQLLIQDRGENTTSWPIIPIFWINENKCWPHATDKAKDLLKGLQLTGPGLPEDYPAMGLSQKMSLGEAQHSERICLYLADRIQELAEREPVLPPLGGIDDFRKLPSAFDSEQTDDKPVQAIPAPVVNLARMAVPAGFARRPKPPTLDLTP